jgi:hypothetical protein
MTATWTGRERRSGDDRRGQRQPSTAAPSLAERLDERRRTQWAYAASARALCAEYGHKPEIARALILAEVIHHAAAIAYEQALELARTAEGT